MTNDIDEYFAQLRPPIVRSSGATPTERYLARLADRTFLDLWSYPNPFRDEKQGANGDGKELCDLLVVCDPHIILFSEKAIGWSDKPTDVAWPRWFRKAVSSASDQLKGAERWIAQFPERIFLDPACQQPLPLSIPLHDGRRIHRVVVARGAADACRRYYGEGLGTLMIKPELKGADHYDPKAETYSPFTVGDIDPNGDFVHVFDEVALDIVIEELDTISDFTEYLDKRADFIRSGRLFIASGEEDLLAHYAMHVNKNGDHDFVPPGNGEWSQEESLIIAPGNFEYYINHDQYKSKKRADEISYLWDYLISNFTKHMLGGTSIVLPGHSFSIKKSEVAVRHMALQRRIVRRSHSEAIKGALEAGQKQEVFFRAMMPGARSKERETGFFILTLQYLDWMHDKGGYKTYRELRTFYLQTYARALLIRAPHLREVVGIAMEPPGRQGGGSEDIIYAAQSDWTRDEREESATDCEQLGIMTSLKETPYHGEEFPILDPAFDDRRPDGNRKQRRASRARARKAGRTG